MDDEEVLEAAKKLLEREDIKLVGWYQDEEEPLVYIRLKEEKTKDIINIQWEV